MENKINEDLIIKIGASFGESMGYNKNELTITSKIITLIQGSNDKTLPEIKKEFKTPPADWRKLIFFFDKERFKLLPTIIGTPDFVDAGEEWVEIRDNSFTKRVTFDYGASITGLESLIKQLRVIKKRVIQKLF